MATREQAGSALASEVAALASQLGLASGVATGGFDDSDFRPEVAIQTLGSHDRLKSSSKNKFKHPANDPSPQLQRRQYVSSEQEAAIKERTWNEGVGERPGAKAAKSLLGMDDSPVWYKAAAILPEVEPSAKPADDAMIEVKTKVAERLMAAEIAAFEKKLSRANPADAQWLQQVRRSGTMRDKVAAASLLVEESVVANIAALDSLLHWARKQKGGREVAGHAIDGLKELFQTVLLPDRHLKSFDSQPFGSVRPSKEGDKRLLYWWTEDCIKKRCPALTCRYNLFVTALEDASCDNLEFLKDKALKAAYELLASKPEQEARLLTLIVNKLGDPNRKIASKAGYLLSCLLTQHPVMAMVVVQELEKFLFRSGQKHRARYYAVVTMNQMVLSHSAAKGGTLLASKLIDIYFTLFQLVLDQKVGVAAELSSAAAANKSKLETNTDAQKKKGFKPRIGLKGKGPKHRKGKSTNGASTEHGSTELTAEVLDARMLGALITGVRRAYPFVDAARLEGVIERHAVQLFRTVHLAPFNVAVQALMLLFQDAANNSASALIGKGKHIKGNHFLQVMRSQDAASDRFYTALYTILLNPSFARSTSVTMFMGVLFQAMKADVSLRRVTAFVKRLLQVALMQQANFTCGILIMISELLKEKPILWAAITQPEDVSAADAAPMNDADAHASDDDNAVAAETTNAHEDGIAASAAVRAEQRRNATSSEDQVWPQQDYYDMFKRAPQFAKAEAACLWELLLLASHVHPSVANMARTLLAGTNIIYDGDPLKDLMLMAFLDKFVTRKAKRSDTDKDKGVSAMQPVQEPERNVQSALGSATFAALAEANVSPDDVFFHKYFTLEGVKKRQAKNRARKKAQKRKNAGDEDALSGSSDEGEGEDEGSEAEDAFLEGEEDGDLVDYGQLAAAFSDEDGDDEEADVEADSDGHGDRGVTDEELDGVNIFDLPSPGSSQEDPESEADDEVSDEASESDDSAPTHGARESAHQVINVTSKGAKKRPAECRSEAYGASEADVFDALAGDGSSDDADIHVNAGTKRQYRASKDTQADEDHNDEDDVDVENLPVLAGSSDDDTDQAGAQRAHPRAKKRSKSVFASYEDYASILDEHEAAGKDARKLQPMQSSRSQANPLKRNKVKHHVSNDAYQGQNVKQARREHPAKIRSESRRKSNKHVALDRPDLRKAGKRRKPE